ncbi:MAG: glutamine--fructose-6-phosphate transaminase (isomerizing) [Chloroflexi bacterium]|nr:glutamine--fructose-6-phosphate transaminase (isomerizing) [Chloroflexota bacterium]
MCGIVGYVGHRQAIPILLEGLQRLEYRGYDSAGVAVLTPEGAMALHKQEGKLRHLRESLNGNAPAGSLGIGHTRWATHGPPTTQNAHPHPDCTGQMVVVHNGIIENYVSLRTELKAQGHTFTSQTDTEVLAHLIEAEYHQLLASANGTTPDSFVEAVRRALIRVKGAYAIAAFHAAFPDLLVGARLFSPLIVGLGEGENFLASDISAILRQTRRTLLLEDGDLAIVTGQGVRTINLDGTPTVREVFHVTWEAEAAERGGYHHFVQKEIYEQPEALRSTLRGRLEIFTPPGETSPQYRPLLAECARLDLGAIRRIVIVACGTSAYAGLTAKYLIENWARLPVEVAIASEFRYSNPVLDRETLCVFISQSGETADTLAACRLALERAAQTLALCNTVGSSLARLTQATLYLQVGPEIGVVATKSYTAQLALLALLALCLAQHRQTLSTALISQYGQELTLVPDLVTQILSDVTPIEAAAHELANRRSIFFLGRGITYPTALEGALKLKEISYIHAEGYPAGELKHGPIAMLEPDIPVVAIAPQGATYEKLISNVQEVRARQSPVLAIATAGDEEISHHADRVLWIPPVSEALAPLLAVIPLQLLAYYVAVIKGCDVDQPRNLAKSVTVE